MQERLNLKAMVGVELVSAGDGFAVVQLVLTDRETGELLSEFEEERLEYGESVAFGPVNIPVTMDLGVERANAASRHFTPLESGEERGLPEKPPTNTLTPSTPQPSPDTGGKHGRTVDAATGPSRHAGALAKRTRGR